MPSLTRLVRFYRENGLGATMARIPVRLRDDYLPRKHVLYAADLASPEISVAPVDATGNEGSVFEIVLRGSEKDVSEEERRVLCYYRGERAVRTQFAEFFGRGASLWILYCDKQPVGLVWTLVGRTVAPHFFALTPTDVHLYDNEIFRDYRGRGMNRPLISEVLRRLARGGAQRAHIETALRNKAEQRSLRKTPFRPYAVVSKFRFLGRSLSYWHRGSREVDALRDGPGGSEGRRIP